MDRPTHIKIILTTSYLQSEKKGALKLPDQTLRLAYRTAIEKGEMTFNIAKGLLRS